MFDLVCAIRMFDIDDDIDTAFLDGDSDTAVSNRGDAGDADGSVPDEEEDGSSDEGGAGSADGEPAAPAAADRQMQGSDEEEEEPDELLPELCEAEDQKQCVVGEEAVHDFLGVKGMVLALARGQQVMDGVTVEFKPIHHAKAFFSWTKVVRKGRHSQRETIRRWVFEDALTRVVRGPPAGTTTEPAPEPTPTAFDEMGARARTAQAFTQGMTAPELAAHERTRARALLKDAAKRGRNAAVNRTKEPKVDPAVR